MPPWKAHHRSPGHGDITVDVSADGDWLVFNAVGDGGRDLYLLHLGSRAVTRIAATAEYELAPSFSPDGKSIVYSAGIHGDRADHLFIRSLVDGTVRQLTFDDANDMSPEFSPDGSQIVFSRCKTYRWGGLAANWSPEAVCVIATDGTGFRELTPRNTAFTGQFLPDGRSVLVSGFKEPHVVSLTDDVAPLATFSIKTRVDDLSSDGKLMAYTIGQYAGDRQIMVSTFDGQDVQRVTKSAKGGWFGPQFIDNEQLLFFHDDWPDGPTGYAKKSLWRINRDGSGQVKLADSDLFDAPLAFGTRSQNDDSR